MCTRRPTLRSYQHEPNDMLAMGKSALAHSATRHLLSGSDADYGSAVWGIAARSTLTVPHGQKDTRDQLSDQRQTPR